MNFHHVVQRDVASDLRVIGEPGEPAKLDQLNKMYVVAGIGPAYQGWYFGKDRWSAHPRQLPCDLPVGDQGVTIRFRMADDVVQAHKDGVLETASLLLDLLFVTSEDVCELAVNGHNIIKVWLVAKCGGTAGRCRVRRLSRAGRVRRRGS